ncbi:hypothetical protein F4777DRAFT_187054 [Nemania sp. FL0916]|nr:hypothetical protein F4777DRAFT_187054 [Nemania sp. FL0916]
MDPLSITASVITLIDAANKVYSVLQSVRHADRSLQALSKEVNTLNGFLGSIEKALEDCRTNAYALTHIDPALWKQSKVALSDCQQTLNEIASIFIEPKRPTRSNTLFRKARIAAELHSRAGQIASFREKISMSNLSLQTLLQVITVSLSLRSNKSHDSILRDLAELKDALKKSSQAATVSYSTLFIDEQDNRLVHHLKGLIRAAQDFHTSASTTASTVVSGGGTQAPPTDFGDDDARSGIASRLPSVKREQIETFLSQNQSIERAVSSASDRSEHEIIPLAAPKKLDVIPGEHKSPDHAFSTIFTSGFSKIAQQALQELDLQRAENLLREALKWHSSSGADDVHQQRRLHTQLALCNLLQGNISEAQDLILDLVDSSIGQDTVAHQLLYATTLLQLHELDFDGAKDNSKRLWEALQKTPYCTVLGANDAMRLLATSYQESGDSLLAAAIEAELPELKLCEPVPKMVDFLVNCEELIVGIFGLQDCSELSNPLSVTHRIHDLPIAKKASSLQMREQLLGDIELPPPKSPSSDIDDNVSVKAYSRFAEDEPKTKKRSWSNLRALFKSRLSWDIGAVDPYLLHTGAQESTFKLRKMRKTTHIMPTSPHESSPDCDASKFQNPIKWRWNSPKVNPEPQNSPDTQNNSRVKEWIMGQAESNQTETKTEDQDADEPRRSLQREFSFRSGVPDDISQGPETTVPTHHELPDNEIRFELMDTSPQPWMATSTSQEMENDIYKMLGCEILTIHPAPNRKPQSTGSDILDDCDASIDYSSAGSTTDVSSDFDQLTQPTRQTTFDTSSISAGEIDQDSDINEDWPLASIKQLKGKGVTESEPCSQPLSRTPSTAKSDLRELIEPDQTASAFQFHALTCEAVDSVTQPRSIKPHARSRREFSSTIAKFCRYKTPGQPVARRPIKFSRLLQAKDRAGDFAGINKALYFGPDAVAGPFTDLGETDSPDEQSTCGSVPRGNSEPSKLHSEFKEKRVQAIIPDEAPDYCHVIPLQSRDSSWKRTQIDEFFDVLREQRSSSDVFSSSG